MKMHLNERFKINILGTTQGLHPMDIFLGRFEDIHRTGFENYKNMQQPIFQHFMQYI